MSNGFDYTPQASAVIIHLFKGILYRDQNETLWQSLISFQSTVRDYVRVIGLEVVIDEVEGFAFLRQRVEEVQDEDDQMPRLIPRRQLGYPLSLLCVLLRKRLVEQDASGGETRVVLSRAKIVDMMRVYLPDSGNEARTVEQIHRHLNKLVDYGFLRKLKGEEDQYEVRRILKALVNAEWLADLDAKLEEYRAYGESNS
jgi:hypothetical protein